MEHTGLPGRYSLNPEDAVDRIVVIGASQGGVLALRALAAQLPSTFPAPILVVVHIGAGHSFLPSILTDAGPLPALHVTGDTALEAGRIYVAPPDHHLVVVDTTAVTSHGPRENWARPAIDPLFRSAAEVFGPRVIGVILTGMLNDGTPGLYEIKRRGGITVVQDPDEAEAPSMPRSALDNVEVDFCVSLAELPALLVRLAGEPPVAARGETPATPREEWTLKAPTAQTCPECGGAMAEEAEGGLSRFRCHIGHVMTAEVLAAAQLEVLESSISVVLRSLNERAALCRELAGKAAARADVEAAADWRRAAEEAERREQAIKGLVRADWNHPEAAAE
jgi:two-component system chemotaxis response regulator CheB